MKSTKIPAVILAFLITTSSLWAQKEKAIKPEHLDFRIDNNAYLNKMADQGLVELVVIGSATPPFACLGDEIQLDVEVIGGLGSYAYTWTSDPPGFNSTLKNPSHTPLESTAYIIHASDGNNAGSDTVMVEVFPFPDLSLGPDTTICPGDAIILDAGPGHSSYEWQDGSINQTYTAAEEGLYWVEVSNQYGCYSLDSLLLTVQEEAQQPAKPAGPSFIDLYETQTTTYETSLIPDAQEYQWEMVPGNAGLIQNNGHEATIQWDTSYAGQVQLSVRTITMCGNSPWSEELMINVVNNFSVSDFEDAPGLQIFPNPSNGSFNISFDADTEIYVNIYISAPSGTRIYSRENIHLSGKIVEQVNLSSYAAGVYSVIVENETGRIIRNIIITE